MHIIVHIYVYIKHNYANIGQN